VTIDLHIDRRGDASTVTVDMGRATFKPAALPCALSVDELIQQPIEAAGRALTFTGVSVGNPHCVVFRQANEPWSRDDLLALGPALEHHAIFPKRTNVQLAIPTGPKDIFILIWERGAGETQASGSSSCAAASAAVRLGLVESPVAVKMPGGTLHIEVAEDFSLTMKGPVAEVARGTLSPSFVRSLK
jgi:diaminopimelate epimerase